MAGNLWRSLAARLMIESLAIYLIDKLPTDAQMRRTNKAQYWTTNERVSPRIFGTVIQSTIHELITLYEGDASTNDVVSSNQQIISTPGMCEKENGGLGMTCDLI